MTVDEESHQVVANHKGQSIAKKFKLKHVFRGGAIVWSKFQGKDYYVVFRSKTRPNRGVQLPGGRVERYENPAKTILREVKEETGVETRIVCPLGVIYYENEDDNYSSLQIYYLVRPVHPLDVSKKWDYVDKDYTQQELECWFESTEKPTDYLAAGQDQVVEMFKNWLDEHKKEQLAYENEFNTSHQELAKEADKTKVSDDVDLEEFHLN